MSDTEREGVAKDLRESPVDIACIPGHGDDVYIKAAGDVLLLDAFEAETLAEEIRETVAETERSGEADR